MNYNIGFYIHHHGSGHLMRALAIAAHLHQTVIFLGSGLRDHQKCIPSQIQCIHLPPDVPDQDDHDYAEGPEVDCLHYAPLNVKGIRRRNQIIGNFFATSYPLLLIVDVSVEITLLARLFGVPTIVIRQHGIRNDTAHLAAYQCASLLLAPYPEKLRTKSIEWVDKKTFFSGGFSRYTGLERPFSYTSHDNYVAIITGKGGTSIDLAFISHLASVCPDFHFQIVGDIFAENYSSANVVFHGICAKPETILNLCRIVVGNAGHNTVMEVADLGKSFICIPEARPFGEQLQKALLIKQFYGIPLVMPDALFTTNWQDLLKEASQSKPKWYDVINEKGLPQIAIAINQVAARSFGMA